MSGVGVGAPVPLILTVTGFSSGSSDGIATLLLNIPVVVGAKCTSKVQLSVGITTKLEHVSFSMLNGAAGATSAKRVKLALPSFVTVTVWSAVVISVTLPNGTCRSAAGATESVTVMSGTGIADPVPSTVTVTGSSSGSSDGISKLSFDGVAAVGAKRTSNVQPAAGFKTALEHVSFRMLNGAASGLAAAILPIVRSAVPSFVTVTV